MRLLQSSSRPSGLARAVTELGRVVKTLFLLASLDDIQYRRRVLTYLTRHEGRHRLGRATFHGQRGELRQRYREGQEDQPGALGLVMNAIILWNTVYVDRAIAVLTAAGAQVRADDVERLSPLGFKHINLVGRYQFALPAAIAAGAFRPLLSGRRCRGCSRMTPALNCGC